MKKSLSARFLAAVGLSSGPEKDAPANASLIKERDEAVEKFGKAADAYAALEQELADTKATHETALATQASAHAEAIKTLTAERDSLKAERDKLNESRADFEKTTRERIKNEEVASVTASQGVPPGNVVPVQNTGESKAEKISALQAQLAAAKDGTEKGRIVQEIRKLKASA